MPMKNKSITRCAVTLPFTPEERSAVNAGSRPVIKYLKFLLLHAKRHAWLSANGDKPTQKRIVCGAWLDPDTGQWRIEAVFFDNARWHRCASTGPRQAPVQWWCLLPDSLPEPLPFDDFRDTPEFEQIAGES